EVREVGVPALSIIAGQRWSIVRKLAEDVRAKTSPSNAASVADAANGADNAAAESAPAKVAPAKPEDAPRPPSPSAAESAFARGWDRIAAGDHDAAAEAFAIAGHDPKSA